MSDLTLVGEFSRALVALDQDGDKLDQTDLTILNGLEDRQDFASALTSVAEMKVIEPTVPLGDLEAPEMLKTVELGPGWDY